MICPKCGKEFLPKIKFKGLYICVDCYNKSLSCYGCIHPSWLSDHHGTSLWCPIRKEYNTGERHIQGKINIVECYKIMPNPKPKSILLTRDEVEMILNWFNYSKYYSKTNIEEFELEVKLLKFMEAL